MAGLFGLAERSGMAGQLGLAGQLGMTERSGMAGLISIIILNISIFFSFCIYIIHIYLYIRLNDKFCP